MQGKSCVITGATSGIGKAVALALGRRGANLVLVGRNERAGQRLAESIESRWSVARAQFFRTDLSVQNEVRDLAGRISAQHPRLDVLINNAGGRFDTYQRSADGIERTFATNHLGHFLLTQLLLENLNRSPDGRVITVSSRSHRSATAIGDWQLSSDNYDRHQAYGKSKLANLLFVYELTRRLEGTSVSSNAVDPGVVATRFARNNGWLPWIKHLVSHGLRGELVSARRAATTIVFLATDEALKGTSGKYFCKMQPVCSSDDSYNLEAARSLWELSASLAGLEKQNGVSRSVSLARMK